MQTAAWRLILSPPNSGPWNMAIDEAILEAAAKKQVPPTLRLYGWEPPCLSIGYAQNIREVDGFRLRQLGWIVVRRPTGGRAILHTDELTYSVCAPLHEPRVAGTVMQSYQRLSRALVRALELMGLHVYADRDHPLPEGASPDEPVCFEVPSSYEITAGEKKLVGSAQARRYMGVLQHGTLPLTGDVSQIVMALNFESEAERLRAAARVAASATTISTVAGREVSWEEAAECLTTAFAQTLNLDLSLGDLTPGEADRAVQLLTEKYGSNSWTERIAFTPVKAV